MASPKLVLESEGEELVVQAVQSFDLIYPYSNAKNSAYVLFDNINILAILLRRKQYSTQELTTFSQAQDSVICSRREAYAARDIDNNIMLSQSNIQIHVASVVIVPRGPYQCICKGEIGPRGYSIDVSLLYTRTNSEASSATSDSSI